MNHINPTFQYHQSTMEEFKAAEVVIKEYVYSCAVPEHSLRSIEEMKLHGTRRDLGDGIGKKPADKFINVAISIKRMTDLFNEGFQFRITDHKKLPEIYKAMRRYLAAWKVLSEQTINYKEYDIEFLLALDKMVTALFPEVVAGMKTCEINDDIMSVHQRKNEIPQVFKTTGNRMLAHTGSKSGAVFMEDAKVVNGLKKTDNQPPSMASFIVDTLGRK